MKDSHPPLRRCTSASRRKPPEFLLPSMLLVIMPFISPIIALIIPLAIFLTTTKGQLMFDGAFARSNGFMPMLMMIIAVGLISIMKLIYLAKLIYMRITNCMTAGACPLGDALPRASGLSGRCMRLMSHRRLVQRARATRHPARATISTLAATASWTSDGLSFSSAAA